MIVVRQQESRDLIGDSGGFGVFAVRQDSDHVARCRIVHQIRAEAEDASAVPDDLVKWPTDFRGGQNATKVRADTGANPKKAP